MPIDRILSPSEVRASEASTVAFVAVAHLEAVALLNAELRTWATQAHLSACQCALAEHWANGSNPFNHPAVHRAQDVILGVDFIAARLAGALEELRAWNQAVQGREELATRERGEHPTH